MAFSLSSQSKKVIDSWMSKKPASNVKLTSDGKTLDGNWMGGGDIAVWKNGKIVMKETGGKAGDTVQNYIRRNAPKNWLSEYNQSQMKSASDVLRNLEMRIARLENRSANQIDTHLVREIELHIENTYTQYQNIQGVISMVQKHKARGNYSESRAIDGFLNLVVVPGIKDYRREHGRNSLPARIDAQTKMAIAKSLFDTYKDEILG
jgi:hypothetical protein